MEQLKVEGKTAKRCFSRLANSITRTYKDMSEEELRDSFSKLTLEAERVMETNDDVEAGLIAECQIGGRPGWSPDMPEPSGLSQATTKQGV